MIEQELHILLVDDDEDDAFIIKDLLDDIQRIKLTFHWAPTYEQGEEILKKEQWSAILVDYDLGRKNGLDFIREANKNEVRAPMIMVTGRGRYEVDIEAMQAGAADYLSKDQLNSSFLERTIRHALERRRNEEELERRVEERTRELRKVDEERRASLALFEGLFEASPDAILLVREDGSIYRANRQVEESFGFEREELEGQPVEKLIPARFHHVHSRHREEYNESPRTRPMGVGLRLFGQHKDGHEFPVDVTLSPLSVNGNIYVICVVRDLSKREERAASQG